MTACVQPLIMHPEAMLDLRRMTARELWKQYHREERIRRKTLAWRPPLQLPRGYTLVGVVATLEGVRFHAGGTWAT